MISLSTVGIYAALLVMTRISGLRSFAKMSSFDFAVTVAFGSILASTILTREPSLSAGAFGLFLLYALQHVVSKARRASSIVERSVDNEPLLIMAGEQVLQDNLDKSRMTEDDLRSKLRGSGITHSRQVLAVVFETTGDVSVLKRGEEVDPWLFEEVRGAEMLSGG